MILLEVSRDTLLRPLQTVCGIVERRATPLPILSSVLLTTAGRQLQFRSTDLELELTAGETLDADPIDTALTVHARKLLDVVRAMPDTVLTLSLSGARLTVQAPGSRIVLHAGDADDFPCLKAPAAAEGSLSVKAGALKRLLHTVHFAMADNDIRYFLNGVLLICGDELTAVANDGHRLALDTLPVPFDGEPRQIIVPRKAVVELIRLLPDDDTAVRIELAAGYAQFSFGAVRLTSKLIDGRYPEFRRAIPSSFDAGFRLARQPFLACLQRAAVLSNGKFAGMQCLAGHGRLQVRAHNPENEESVEEIAIDYDGAPVDLSFNIRYLLDAMSTLRTETLEWHMSESSLSALIVAPEQAGFKYVVMAFRK